jgi:hypothetical protein
VVEHVPCATPDKELERPSPCRLTAGVVFTDGRREGFAIGTKGFGVVSGLQGNLDADLRGEFVDLRSVDVTDDPLLVPTTTPWTLSKLW